MGWLKRGPAQDPPLADISGTLSSTGDAPDAKGSIKAAATALESSWKSWRRELETARKALEKAERTREKRLENARKQVERAGEPVKLGGIFMGGVTLYEDRIKLNGKTLPLRADVTAVADTAGNLSRTRRHTLTRFAVLGPFAVFAPKGTKHDDREMFLLVECADWAEMAKLDPKKQGEARQLAQQINLAARQIDKAQAARRERVSRATEEFKHLVAATEEIDRGREALEAAHTDQGLVRDQRDEVERLVAGSPDPESRWTRGAARLIEETGSGLAAAVPYPREATIPILPPSPGQLEAPVVSSDVARLPPTVGGVSPADDMAARLERLVFLRGQGLISEAEHDDKRRQILEEL